MWLVKFSLFFKKDKMRFVDNINIEYLAKKSKLLSSILLSSILIFFNINLFIVNGLFTYILIFHFTYNRDSIFTSVLLLKWRLNGTYDRAILVNSWAVLIIETKDYIYLTSHNYLVNLEILLNHQKLRHISLKSVKLWHCTKV